MILECPCCQSCFTLEELISSANATLAVQNFMCGTEDLVPEKLDEDELYKFLCEDVYNLDCPECEEVIFVTDMCII